MAAVARDTKKVSDAAERRTAQRIPAAAMPSIARVRISPVGTDASLVDISSTGVLVRCSTRLLPGTPVTVIFEGTFPVNSVKGAVVRCLVADIGRPTGLSYHIGISFKEPIPLGDEQATPSLPAAPPAHAAPPTFLVNRW